MLTFLAVCLSMPMEWKWVVDIFVVVAVVIAFFSCGRLQFGFQLTNLVMAWNTHLKEIRLFAAL